jgi:hypothetical protein
VAIGDQIDQVEYRGAADIDLADVLALEGSNEDAVAALERAAEIFGRKGDVAVVQRLRKRIDELHRLAGVGLTA